MNFHSLDYFLVLAREKNFTRAAEALHITQQSLSSHIAGLEKELGCTLLVRRTPLELTYAGRTFLRYAESIGQTRQAMEREFCDISENQKGELRVGIAYTRGRAIMPRLIPAFQRQYPNVEITLLEGSNDAIQKALLSGGIDLAIAGFPRPLPGVVLEDYYLEHIVLCLSDGLLAQCGIDLDTHLRGRHRRAHRARTFALLGRLARQQSNIRKRRNAARALRAGRRRMLLPGKSAAHSALARAACAPAYSPALPTGVLSHLLWVLEPLVSVERALGIHPHRPRANCISTIKTPPVHLLHGRRSFLLLHRRLLLGDAVDIAAAEGDLLRLHTHDLAVGEHLAHLFDGDCVVFVAVLRQDDAAVDDEEVHIRRDADLAVLTGNGAFHSVDGIRALE